MCGREALAADLGPLSASALGKGDWQYAVYGLASLFCAGAMQGEYSSRQDALRNNAHCVPHSIVSLMSVIKGGEGIEEPLGDVVEIVTRCIVGMLRKGDGRVGGRVFDDRGRRQGVVILLECLVREAEVLAPNVRRHSVPFTLTRAERLDQLSKYGAKAKFSFGDEDEEGDPPSA